MRPLACTTRDSQGHLTRVLAGFLLDGCTLDQKDLPDVGNVEGRIERCTAPDASRLDATVILWCDLDKVGGFAVLEQEAISRSSVGWLPLQSPKRPCAWEDFKGR